MPKCIIIKVENNQSERIYTPKDIGYFRSTDRPFENYRLLFGISPPELKKNAVILDAGSGKRQEFARGLAKLRPDIQVISLDPSLSLPTDAKSLKKMGIYYDIVSLSRKHKTTKADRDSRLKNKFGDIIPAIAPHLPFKDQSFDYIFDNHGPFMYFAPDQNELQRYVGELLRILKPEGQLNIYPLDTYSEGLDDDEKKLQASRTRIENIMQAIGVTTFETFTALDVGRHNRLGVKIFKK